MLAGEQATILVIHDQIDPIQQTAIEIAAQMAIQEVNATVLTSLATDARSSLAPAGDVAAKPRSSPAASLTPTPRVPTRPPTAKLSTTASTTSATSSTGRSPYSTASATAQAPTRPVSRQTRADVVALRERVAGVESSTPDDVAALAADVQALTGRLDDSVVLEPEVLIRPFTSATENALPEPINPTEYFTPASLALLLQHLAITFASLSLVRDRRGGLFELMRVGPLSSIEILIGKSLAYCARRHASPAALVSAAVYRARRAVCGQSWRGWR